VLQRRYSTPLTYMIFDVLSVEDEGKGRAVIRSVG
jgi:hypothetical protein